MLQKTIIALLLFFASFAVRAQPVFQITASPVDSMTLGSAEPLELRTYVINQTAATLSLRWQLITDSTTYASDWEFMAIFDNYLGYVPQTSAFNYAVITTDTISPGDSSVLKILVHVPASSPNGSTGLFKIKVFDSLQTQVDTIVYRICKGFGCVFPAYGPSPGGGTAIPNITNKGPYFSIYPNPAADKAYINMASGNTQLPGLRMKLYDYTGRMLLEQKLPAQAAAIDLSRVKPGMYFIRLYQGDQYLGGQKINRL